MWASCDPRAAFQPIRAAAITQMAITANMVFCGDACTIKKATGAGHSRDQATVRHGMNQRDIGREPASAAIRNGVASRASSQAPGTVCGCATVAVPLAFSRLAQISR